MLKKLKTKIIKKREKKEKKKKNRRRKKKDRSWGRKTPQNCKSPMQRWRLITTIESVTEYTYIHTHP